MKNQGFNTVRLNAPVHPLRDLYYKFLKMRWSYFMTIMLILFFVINCIFAGLYLIDPTGMASVEQMNFFDAFFFSVQTFSTVGYGAISPVSFQNNLIATTEILWA